MRGGGGSGFPASGSAGEACAGFANASVLWIMELYMAHNVCPRYITAPTCPGFLLVSLDHHNGLITLKRWTPNLQGPGTLGVPIA